MKAFAPWAEPVLMTADQLFHLPEDGWRYELVKGRLVRMAPTGSEHGRVATELFFAVTQFVKEHGLGLVFPPETGFLISLKGQADTVLAPDLALVRAERKQAADVTGYARLAPDLVAEVASPSQGRREMRAKARQWLESGVRMAWLVFPRSRSVEVWRPGESARLLSEADSLTGEDVLPDFSVSVASLFP
jgi:Uma2 family endonuclease